MEFEVQVDEGLCDGCGLCVELCPSSVFSMENGVAKPIGERCIGCGGCVPLCPRKAITLLIDP